MKEADRETIGVCRCPLTVLSLSAASSTGKGATAVMGDPLGSGGSDHFRAHSPNYMVQDARVGGLVDFWEGVVLTTNEVLFLAGCGWRLGWTTVRGTVDCPNSIAREDATFYSLLFSNIMICACSCGEFISSRCISSINRQLGKAASAVFYESLVSPSIVASEDVVTCLLKILETGYKSSTTASHISQFGGDVDWGKELAHHKNQRKFSVEMSIALHALCYKAIGWDRVLDVIEKYLKYLIPNKCLQSSDPSEFFNINASLLVHATSQISRVMVESAFDVLMFLNYLVIVSGQVLIAHQDISRIHLELIPMLQEIIIQWLILHLVATMPSESPLLEDFSSRLSLLKIGNYIGCFVI
ncbi:hypothetical protein ACLOJK_004262 [Asimina triloba]